MLKEAAAQIDALADDGKLTAATREALRANLMSSVFHGADANDGVASAAKMNMIIAGDGHANIAGEDTLKADAAIWKRQIDLVLTNPPFGTSESDSLTAADRATYEVDTTKGQLLFLQRMVKETAPEGLICTVIDEGVLNTETAAPIRRLILEQCRVRAVVRLPAETFKPNKINVRAALLVLERREHRDVDLTSVYTLRFIDVHSLGYDGTGNPLRGFEFGTLVEEIERLNRTAASLEPAEGYGWSSFGVSSSDLADEKTHRLDLKFWRPALRARLAELSASGAPTIKDLNLVETSRGRSPSAELYVDPTDGYARVLKAGSSIDSFGQTTPIGPDTDFIEKAEYDKAPVHCKVKRHDVLLSSTGDGTLGKAAVYEDSNPAVADGHITVIRVDRSKVLPRYLADYLRAGFGHEQVERLYTGSTGLIELTTQDVETILVDLPSIEEQRRSSQALRRSERSYRLAATKAEDRLLHARQTFVDA